MELRNNKPSIRGLGVSQQRAYTERYLIYLLRILYYFLKKIQEDWESLFKNGE